MNVAKHNEDKVVKIQASFRGAKARKQVKEMIEQDNSF